MPKSTLLHCSFGVLLHALKPLARPSLPGYSQILHSPPALQARSPPRALWVRLVSSSPGVSIAHCWWWTSTGVVGQLAGSN